MSADPASSVRVAPLGTSAISPASALLPSNDTLWHEVYHVTALLAEANGVRLWQANRTDTAEEVVLRVTPTAQCEARSEAWPRLCGIELSHLQRVREVQHVGGCQVAVCDPIPGLPLDAWRSQRASVDIATVEAVVRQLAEALGVLHSSGLVHLGLRPGVVYVREGPDGLHFTLGGLDTVCRSEGQQPFAALADPLYAPPEVAALEMHEPGHALCAWDWWSLGRVAQELILGHHVVDLLPETEIGASPSQRLARAESLLLGRETKGLCAGAVEMMTELDPRLKLLLRGLLASSPEGRWGPEFVDRWLRQKSVKEHYGLPWSEVKFRLRGRLHTVHEAAKALQSAELWAEAAPHVFEAGTPGTLANFIRESDTHALLRPQFAELLKSVEAEPLCSLPPALAREILLTVALAQLSGSVVVRCGRRLDAACLHALLAEEPDNPERFALVRAFTHRTITMRIERFDFEGGRSLAAIERVATDAETFIRRQGWLTADDAGAGEKIFRLALEPETTLRAARERLQRDFAGSKQPAVDAIFKNPRPARSEFVALTWVEPSAPKFGFITHAEDTVLKLQALHQRGAPIISALFWARLGRALAPGALLFGPCWISAVVWGLAIGLIAAMWSGLTGAAGALSLLAFLAIMRVGFTSALRPAVSRFSPASPVWAFNDGAARCLVEMQAVAGGLDAARLENSLRELNAEIAKFTLTGPPPAPLAEPPHFGGMRIAAFASWIVLLGIFAGLGWHAIANPPSWTTSVVSISSPAKTVRTTATTSDAGSAGSDAKVSWPHRPGDDPDTPTIKDTLTATREQIEYAKRRGSALAAPYRPETISTLIIFSVRAGDDIAVMVYDGKRGKLVNEKVYLLSYRLRTRSWVQVEESAGIYLED